MILSLRCCKCRGRMGAILPAKRRRRRRRRGRRGEQRLPPDLRRGPPASDHSTSPCHPATRLSAATTHRATRRPPPATNPTNTVHIEAIVTHTHTHTHIYSPAPTLSHCVRRWPTVTGILRAGSESGTHPATVS